MLQIKDTIVSLDMAERFFCCDLDACKGQCCLDGDAGAPLEPGEADKIRRVLPIIWADLLPAAQQAITDSGISYIDEEGDEVTQLVDGANCVFATIDDNGCWICALEKAYRQGRISFFKPVSCHLYPARIKQYQGFTAVNFHRWKICKAAEVLGRAKGIRAFQFLKEPLTRRFGSEWYDELNLTCTEYLKYIEKEKQP